VKLESSYDSKEGIPDGYADLFTEEDDKFVFTGVTGIKTQKDIDKLNEANRKVRADLKKANDALKAFGDQSPEEIASSLEELEELRGRVDDGDDATVEERINKAAEARVKRLMGPIERKLQKAEKDREEAVGSRDALQGEITSGKITSALNKAIATMGVRSSAVEDVLMYERIFEFTEEGEARTRDGVGVTPGLSTDEWMKDMKESKPHWWDPSKGGGSKGSSGGSSANDVEKMTTEEKLGYRG